jgi:hypothetical protein
MLKQIQMYLLLALFAFSVIAGGATLVLWRRNNVLSLELYQIQNSYNKAKSNLRLVSAQLDQERKNRVAAESALTELRSVPHDDYHTPLPDSIGSVLDNFHRGMQPH